MPSLIVFMKQTKIFITNVEDCPWRMCYKISYYKYDYESLKETEVAKTEPLFKEVLYESGDAMALFELGKNYFNEKNIFFNKLGKTLENV